MDADTLVLTIRPETLTEFPLGSDLETYLKAANERLRTLPREDLLAIINSDVVVEVVHE